MYQFILLIHVFVAICVIALVLVQQGKGATMGAAFGSGASQTVFGSRGSGSFLFRLTIGLIAVFFITSIALNYIATRAYKQQAVITLPASITKRVPVADPATTIPSPTDIPVNNAAAPAANLPTTTPVVPNSDLPIKKN